MAGATFKKPTYKEAVSVQSENKPAAQTNIPVEVLSYAGATTDTAKVNIDNDAKTISVDVLGSGCDGDGNEITETYVSDIKLAQEDEELVLTATAKSGAVLSKERLAFDLARAKGLYYDIDREIDPENALWYLTTEVDEQGYGTKESIIPGTAGYNIGSGGGGGGGGGGTEVAVAVIDPKTGEPMWPSTIALNTAATIGIYWTSKKRGNPTGPGNVAVYVNDKKVISRACDQGYAYFEVTQFMAAGDNIVKVVVTDMYGTTEQVVGLISAVALSIESNFDYSMPYTGNIAYRYIPFGAVDKDVVFIVDDNTPNRVESHQRVKSTGEQQTFMIRNLTHGSHTLTVYMKAMIDGVEVLSNELFYDLIYYKAGERTPIIASEFRSKVQYQYASFQIPYRVYTPGRDTSEVELYVNGDKLGETLSVGQGKKFWTYRASETGSLTLEIRVGEVSKVFELTIEELNVPVEPVTDSLALSLNAVGRNNDEPLDSRIKWEDAAHGISCELSDFNWSSNGWMQDEDGVDILRIAGSARVMIPYKPFRSNFTNTGKTFEFEIATRDVKAYDSVIVSCLMGGDTISRMTWLVGEDDRIKRFEAASVNEEKFKAKVVEYGQYVFIYSEEIGWQLNARGILIPVSLEEISTEYGITLKYIDITGKDIKEPYKDYFMEGDRFIITYEIVGRGVYLTPQLAKLQAQQSSLATQYKENDHVRLTFVIESTAENRLMYMYINGIMSGVTVYPTSENFEQSTPQPILIGSSDATVDIYNLRIYDAALSRKQVVNNWIADTNDMALKKDRYDKNNNYDDYGNLVISKLPPETPYMILTAPDLPHYKKDRKAVDVKFVYPMDDSRSFTAPKARADVQGTSSQYYYRKNFKIKFENGFYIGGSPDLSEHYHLTPQAKKEKTFTFKADVASSEGTNNVELVRYFEDTKNFDVPPEKIQDPDDTAEGYKTSERIRVGIDGFPIVMFHAVDETADPKFYGKMNFNNDKSNDRTFGFKDGDECWEFTNNSNKLVQFQEADMRIWQDSFESRYPEEYGDDQHPYGTGPGELDKLTEVVKWVVSTRRLDTDTDEQKAAKLLKFRNELPIYFDQTSSLFYYLFTELFLMVDSRAKNAMMCYYKSRVPGDGGNKWFWIPYDMDTALGINNEGLLVFDYDAEDTDLVNGANVYNGQASTFWNNIRDAFPTELRDMYTKLRAEKWSFDSIEKYFEDHQNVWSETIYNEDAYTKYLEPLLLESDASYLGMAQGSKAEQRRWWMANRFKYLDSKYRAGDAAGENVMFRVYGKGPLNIVPYINCFVTAVFDQAQNYISKDAEKNKPTEIIPPETWDPEGNDAVLALYSADMIKDFGDLSPFKPGYANFSAASKLQRLKVGDPSIENKKMTGLMVGNNHLLTEIDARNCTNLGYGDGTEVTKTIDLSGCVSIEKVLFDNTQILGVQFPVGGYLKEVSLPATITMLELRDHPGLTDLRLESTKNLESLWLENIPSSTIDAYKIVKDLPAGGSVRLIGIDNKFDNVGQIYEFYNVLDTMRGRRADGVEADIHTSVTGTISIDEINYSDYAVLLNRYPGVKIKAETIKCAVKFYNDGIQWGEEQIVNQGEDAIAPAIPTRQENQQFYYTFREWDQSFENVQTDLNINAVYDEHLQQYQVNFHTQSTRPAPIPSQTIYYGETAVEPPAPSIIGAQFLGWFLDKAAAVPFTFDTPILDDTELYAGWRDEDDPTFVKVIHESHNRIEFTLQDNVGIGAYAVTMTDAEPAEWIDIEPDIQYTGHYEVPMAGNYWVWGKDVAGRIIKSNMLTAYSLNIADAPGILDVKAFAIDKDGNEKPVGNVVLDGTSLTIKTNLNIHYTYAYMELTEGENTYHYDLSGEQTTTYVQANNISIAVGYERMTYYVDFYMFGKGNHIAQQTLKYGDYVARPANQYENGEIIGDWYASYDPRNEEFSDLWIFDEMPIDRNLTLYAKWIPYKEPTEITIDVNSGDTIYVNYWQEEPNGVDIQWEELNEVMSSAGTAGDVSMSHTYSEGGRKILKLFNVHGRYNIGQTSAIVSVIQPAQAIRDIKFAFNISRPNNGALIGASSLTKLTLTPYMTELSNSMCADCTSLAEVDVAGARLEKLGDNAFTNTLITTLDWLPQTVTSLGDMCFYGCGALTSANLPDSITSFGSYCFSFCTGLTSIHLPEELTVISEHCFDGDKFVEFDVPEHIKHIGSNAFNNNDQLTKFILRNPAATIGSDGIFTDTVGLRTAGPIGEDGSCNYNFNFAWGEKIPDNAFKTTNARGNPFYEITVPSNLKTIGNNAFDRTNLVEITLPDSLVTIGRDAFVLMNFLTSIVIPSKVTYIGANAFAHDGNLMSVKIYSSHIYLDEQQHKVLTVDNAWFFDSPNIGTVYGTFATEEASNEAFGSKWLYVNNSTKPDYQQL